MENEKIRDTAITAQGAEITKLHGHAVIQLFENGAEVEKIEEDNIVTNAVTNFLNVPVELNYSGTPWCTAALSNAQPFYSKAYSGLMLFDDTIDEDADLILPPKDVSGVGHAGSVYSGAATTRGTLNTNETGAITNGYRYVWDFGTDRANGTIKSMALTSQMGGNVGWGGHEENVYLVYNNNPGDELYTGQNFTAVSNYIRAAYQDITAIVGTSGFSAFYATADYVLGIVYSTNKVYKINFEPKTALKLMSAPNRVTGGEELFTADTNAMVYVSGGKIQTVALTGATAISHKTYTLAGVLETTVTVALDTECYVNSGYRPFCWNGDYYAALNTDHYLARFSSAGAYQETIYSIDAGAYAFYIDDKSGVGVANLSGRSSAIYKNALVLTENGVLSYCTHNGNPYYSANPMKYDGLNLPNIALNRSIVSASKTYLDIEIGRFNQYLGTINNLANAVTKTSANTMKVTYEITES